MKLNWDDSLFWLAGWEAIASLSQTRPRSGLTAYHVARRFCCVSLFQPGKWGAVSVYFVPFFFRLLNLCLIKVVGNKNIWHIMRHLNYLANYLTTNIWQYLKYLFNI